MQKVLVHLQRADADRNRRIEESVVDVRERRVGEQESQDGRKQEDDPARRLMMNEPKGAAQLSDHHLSQPIA